jgi:glycosyltransferase involved in cell wall biosynthesis
MKVTTPTATPLVSIITPSFNSARFITETIESVKTQDYPAIEHIVIDGGSTDGTQQILARYPHLVWVSEADRGQSHALNKGFQRARGEIIGWLNADDTYRPGAISNAAGYLLENEEVDLVYSDLLVVDEHNQPIRVARAQAFDLDRLLVSNFIKQPTVFMRRGVIAQLGGVDERLHFVMDRELWLRAAPIFRMQYLENRVLANFRFCPGTKSFEQTPGFHAEWLKVLEGALAVSPLSALPESTKRRALQKTRAKYHLAHVSKAAGRKEHKEMIKHFILAAAADWRILANRGAWFFLAQGLFAPVLERPLKPADQPGSLARTGHSDDV